MGRLSVFVSLLTLYEDAAHGLGYDELTDADRKVMLALWTCVKSENTEFHCPYSSVEARTSAISRTQFYSSIQNLERLGIIKRVGSPRSQRYLFTG